MLCYVLSIRFHKIKLFIWIFRQILSFDCFCYHGKISQWHEQICHPALTLHYHHRHPSQQPGRQSPGVHTCPGTPAEGRTSSGCTSRSRACTCPLAATCPPARPTSRQAAHCPLPEQGDWCPCRQNIVHLYQIHLFTRHFKNSVKLKSTNSNVHEHVHCRQSTKFGAHEINRFHCIRHLKYRLSCSKSGFFQFSVIPMRTYLTCIPWSICSTTSPSSSCFR